MIDLEIVLYIVVLICLAIALFLFIMLMLNFALEFINDFLDKLEQYSYRKERMKARKQND